MDTKYIFGWMNIVLKYQHDILTFRYKKYVCLQSLIFDNICTMYIVPTTFTHIQTCAYAYTKCDDASSKHFKGYF